MRQRRVLASALGLAILASCRTRIAEAPDTVPADTPRPTQRQSSGAPPAAPDQVRIDPGAPLPALPRPRAPQVYALARLPESRGSPAPSNFNPDPGAAQATLSATEPSFFSGTDALAAPAAAPAEAPPPSLARGPLERVQIQAQAAAPAEAAAYGSGPLPDALRLPRAQVREDRYVPGNWTAPDAYQGSEPGGSFPGAAQVPDRWHVGFVPWRRYTAGDTDEMPYFHSDPAFWHYYRQSTLKGDRPVKGQDLFLRLTASAAVTGEDRALPVPSLDSAARAQSSDFYGQSRSQLFTSDFALDLDLFKGDTVFKPVDWLVRIKPVFNYNYVSFRETGDVSPDPRGSLTSVV